MMVRKLAAVVVLGLATAFAATSYAEAARWVVANTTVNVRAGPGAQFHRVGRLHRGQRARLMECRRNGRWCFVRKNGANGWVAARFLRRPGGGGGGGNRICFYGAHGHICIGN